jgi:hypothetical protein
MSFSIQWDVEKSTEEIKTKPIIFDDATTTPTVNSAVTTATDAAGVDQTASIINSTSIVAPNTVNIQLKGGINKALYLIKAQATMASGDIMTSYGVLKIFNPLPY